MPLVTKRAAARRDLVEQFVYLAENAGLNVAERFLSPAEGLVDNSRSSDSPKTITAEA
jgi:plasmid stabilization system protein ParE